MGKMSLLHMRHLDADQSGCILSKSAVSTQLYIVPATQVYWWKSILFTGSWNSLRFWNQLTVLCQSLLNCTV